MVSGNHMVKNMGNVREILKRQKISIKSPLPLKGIDIKLAVPANNIDARKKKGIW
jgi:hypothetical protein